MFAQLMSEMLTPSTFESFRVYSLDTTARLRETLELVDDINRGRIPAATMLPIYQELTWSFSKDQATKALASDAVSSLSLILKQAPNVRLGDIASHIKLIQKLVDDNYKAKIEELILAIFKIPTRRIDLRKLVGFYCSHLINIGYQRRYVLGLVHAHFLDKRIQRASAATLSRFFREFDGGKKKFIAHSAVTRDVGMYLKGLGYVVRQFGSLTPDQAAILADNTNIENLEMVLEVTSEQFDTHAAMIHSLQVLSSQRAIAYLDPYGMRFEWGDTMHVARARAKRGVSVTKGDLLLNSPLRGAQRSGNRLRDIRNYARNIFSQFDGPSTERLLSSINTAALARTSVNPENQLISFWSAIEVLLSEPKDEARIVHYATLIVPCIALRHARRQVISIYDELLVSYRSRFRKLVWQIDKASDFPALAFAELMFLPQHAPLRTELCNILSRNPLALHRVWKLHEDYKEIRAAHRTIGDHFDRVNWQIHRIYRARNQLVHSGRMPTYLESLILNLAGYFRSSIAAIIGKARAENRLSNIDQVVAEIGIHYDIMRRKLSNRPADQAQLTPDDVRMIMDR